MKPPIPARPINGGRLELSPINLVNHSAELKLNGRRLVVSVSDWSVWNRHQEPFTAASECAGALAQMKKINSDFCTHFDAEAIYGRHQLAKGSIVIFDYIAATLQRIKETYLDRRNRLEGLGIPLLPIDPSEWKENTLYLEQRPNLSASALYELSKLMNEKVRCLAYEGVVAKKVDSKYPFTPTPTKEFPSWIKFRHA